MSRLRGNRRTSKTSNINETTSDVHTRQLQSTTHVNKFYKKLVKVCLTECEKLHKFIKQENEHTRNLLKELITTVKDTSSQRRTYQLKASTMIVSKLDACHCDSMKLIQETLSQINRSKFRKDITGAKKLIEKTWNEKYKGRDDLYWRCHHNKRLGKLYNAELSKKNLCIPRKFLQNYNGKETPE